MTLLSIHALGGYHVCVGLCVMHDAVLSFRTGGLSERVQQQQSILGTLMIFYRDPLVLFLSHYAL